MRLLILHAARTPFVTLSVLLMALKYWHAECIIYTSSGIDLTPLCKVKHVLKEVC